MAVTVATPTMTAKESSNVADNYGDEVTAGNFSVGDTVTAAGLATKLHGTGRILFSSSPHWELDLWGTVTDRAPAATAAR